MIYKLSDICGYVKGKVDISKLALCTYISTENMLSNKAGIIESSALPNIKQTQIYRAGDVLVSNIRPYFKKIWYATYDGGCSNDVLVFRAKNGVSKRFLYYVLADDNFFSYSMLNSKGTKMPRGDKKAIMEYKVPKFSYEEQVKIAKILGDLDDKVAVNKEINRNLSEQAQAYFEELFIQNASVEWKEGTLSDVGSIVAGGTPSKSNQEYYTDNGIAWITPKDLSVDKAVFVSHGENDITELGLQKSSATMMPAGTVLFSSRAPIGYIAIAANEVCTNQGFKSVVPNDNVGTSYVYYLLKQLLPTIENMASGSTFKEISGSAMKIVPTVIPDDETLKRFSDFCDPIMKQIQKNEQESKRLVELRATLLPKLMSGKIDVSDLKI